MVKGLWILLAAVCWAQAPAPKPLIENTGKPIRVPLTCGNEEILELALTCPAEQPCPVFLEISSLEAVGNRLFAGGNLHTESATLESILLASDDAGKTWHEPHTRIRQASLDRVSFADLEHGWASGHVMTAFPRDPFFLMTRDGGKTWRSQPVTADGRAGAIEWFQFESGTTGSAWIDRAHAAVNGNRWEAYQTTTGGDVWSLREMTDKAPALARAVPPAGWRLQPDAASKSYRIERLVSGRWALAASFLVRAGECKEQETPPAAPPVPDAPAAKPAPPAEE